MLVIERTRIRPFRPVLAQDMELLRGQDPLPFGVRLRDLEFLDIGMRLPPSEQVPGQWLGRVNARVRAGD